MLIPANVRHQVRERLQMILSALELDRPKDFVKHVGELANIANAYLQELQEKPRPEPDDPTH